MKQGLTEEQFAAFIGIDWADTKHDLCLQAVGCEKHETSILEHTPEAIEAWASAIPWCKQIRVVFVWALA